VHTVTKYTFVYFRKPSWETLLPIIKQVFQKGIMNIHQNCPVQSDCSRPSYLPHPLSPTHKHPIVGIGNYTKPPWNYLCIMKDELYFSNVCLFIGYFWTKICVLPKTRIICSFEEYLLQFIEIKELESIQNTVCSDTYSY
jgi:hypothetical protein